MFLQRPERLVGGAARVALAPDSMGFGANRPPELTWALHKGPNNGAGQDKTLFVCSQSFAGSLASG